MSEHVMSGSPAQAQAHAHAAENPHPKAKTYIAIAVVLTVITIVEVAVFYVPALKPVLLPILLSLSALKFWMVAAFYMHLKFDHKLFSWVFVVPMAFMVAIMVALLALFGVLSGHRPS